jgi:D-galactonate transporter
MPSRMRWLIGSLMFLGGMINYLDRSALAVAAPFVTKDLGLDPAQLGIVFSAFSFGYAPFCFVGGYLSDRFGPRRVMAGAMVGWSIFCGLTAAVFSLGSLIVVRMVFGFAEGPIGSTSTKMVRNWFPHREQATAVSLANAGTPLGAAASGPIVGFAAVAFGWRAAFVVISLLGLIWVLAWLPLVSDRPQTNRRVSAEELAEIERGQAQQPAPRAEGAKFGALLWRPPVLATAFAFFTYSCILYFFLTWFPSYLSMARHLSIRSMSFATMIPWLVGFVGLAAGGPLSDFLFRLTGNALLARKIVLIGGLLAAAVGIALAGQADTVVGAVALMAVSVFFMYLTGNCYWAVILDSVEQSRVGGVSGFVHFIANCGGIVAPLVTGFIVKSTGSFTSAFLLTGAIAVLGATGVAVFVRQGATQGAPSLGRLQKDAGA